MDSLTEEEKQVVEELRRRTINDVTPKMLEDDPNLFYRFAKGRNFNIENAETMLRNHIQWRKDTGYDTILTEYKPPEVLLKYVPTSFVCFDKEGRMVRLIDCGRADPTGLWNVATKIELAKYSSYTVAQDIQRLLSRGGNFKKPVYSAIVDLEDLSYRTVTSLKHIPYLYYLIKMYLDNCPEILRTLTIINTPFYFYGAYALIKSFVPAVIIQKVRIFGREGWKELLLEEIHPDDLPAYLGGNRTDPDGNPLCKTFIHRGEPIPRRYYM